MIDLYVFPSPNVTIYCSNIMFIKVYHNLITVCSACIETQVNYAYLYFYNKYVKM